MSEFSSAEKLKMGDTIAEGLKVYQENFGLLLWATLVAVLISGCSFGICFGPMMCGLLNMIDRLIRKDENKPVFGDLFKGFDMFAQSFLTWLVIGVVGALVCFVLNFMPVVGNLASLMLSFVLGPIMTWSFMLIVHRKMKGMAAVGFVLRETLNGTFILPLLTVLVASLVSGLGVIACGVGIVFTLPVAYTASAVAYRKLFSANA